MPVKFFLPAAAALFLSLPASAFNLAEALAAAESHSPELAAARYEREAEQERPNQARSALLPQINANVLHQRQPESVSANTRSSGWNVQAEQTLFDKGKWLQYRQGKLAAESADLKLRHTASEIRLKTAQAYFDVLSAREQLAAVRAERRAFAQQVRQSQAMFHTGTATKIDMQEALSGYDGAAAKEIAVLNRLQLAQSALENLTGLDGSRAANLTLPMPLPNPTDGKTQEHWQQTAFEHNPELARQKLSAENARLAFSETRARHLPRITAAAGYQDYHNRQEYGGRSQSYRSKGATLSVQLAVPLFGGGLTASQSREAAARLSQSEALLAARRTQYQSGSQPVVS
ncbi:TolC family protein [Kingella potus]|uniref:TolC family protein n=1 Tax=Kingella potus TaxID=265175 RepID=UPI002467BFFE|nr:TolC family protein [Kingella potus]